MNNNRDWGGGGGVSTRPTGEHTLLNLISRIILVANINPLVPRQLFFKYFTENWNIRQVYCQTKLYCWIF